MAVVLGIIILLFTFVVAMVVELARGMTTAPSMHRSRFVEIMVTGVPVAFLVAAIHWLPW